MAKVSDMKGLVLTNITAGVTSVLPCGPSSYRNGTFIDIPKEQVYAYSPIRATDGLRL